MNLPYQALTPESARSPDSPNLVSAAPTSLEEADLSQKYCLVVIPTYNQALNIERLVIAILSQNPVFDVLVVDDNAPDGTGDLVAALAAQSSRVQLLRRAGQLGLGSAYIEGLREGLRQGYRYLCEMDADFSHQPHYLPTLLAAVERTADVAIGSRNIQGGRVEQWSWVRPLITKAGSLYTRTILGLPIRDCASGFKCFRAEVLQQIDLDTIGSNGYAFQVELSYRYRSWHWHGRMKSMRW